MVGLRE